MRADRRRLTLALLLSLLMHSLLLSLTFGGQMLGLPDFDFPWRERRVEAPDLRVVLVPAQVTAAEPAGTLAQEPPQLASIAPTVAGGPALTPPVPSATNLGRAAEVIVLKDKAEPAPDIATGAVAAKAPPRTEPSGDALATPIPLPEVIAVAQSDKATWVVPAATPEPTPVIAVAPSAPIAPGLETVTPPPRDVGEVAQKRAEPEVRERVVEVAKLDTPEREVQTQRQRQADQLEAARVEAAQREAARQEAARVEVLRLDAGRVETQRQEAARVAAAQLDTERQDVARKEAARVEAARLEIQRRGDARLAVAQLETQRLDVARKEAAQLEAQRKEATRLAAARLETDRQTAVRQAAVQQAAAQQAAAQKDAARIQEEKEEDARRAARREAMGRQLNEEAARRDAAATAARSPSTLPYSLSTARRFRLLGRSDPNVELIEYAEAWARRIQLNTPFDTVREVAKRPHTNPMVTVAIRSDGSVESVTFVVSSGVAEVDEAIRLIVQSSVPYPAFPPGLAREYDVIEVRRTWHFDTAIRLY